MTAVIIIIDHILLLYWVCLRARFSQERSVYNVHSPGLIINIIERSRITSCSHINLT